MNTFAICPVHVRENRITCVSARRFRSMICADCSREDLHDEADRWPDEGSSLNCKRINFEFEPRVIDKYLEQFERWCNWKETKRNFCLYVLLFYYFIRFIILLFYVLLFYYFLYFMYFIILLFVHMFYYLLGKHKRMKKYINMLEIFLMI